MESTAKKTITVKNIIQAPVEKVWEYYTAPEHVTQWNNASEDWHTPTAENDLRAGGSFKYRMEAKDGSMGFDFGGVYDAVKTNELIAYTMGDGRKASVHFTGNGNETSVAVTFDPENQHPLEFQRDGWQSILDNFKKYVEAI